MAKIFQIRRGKREKLPVLAQGEFGMTTDERGLYLGTGAENIRFAALAADGKVPLDQLPPLNYDPSGSAIAVQNNLNAHTGNRNNPHGVTAEQAGAIPIGQKGVSNGVATLGADGKVPTNQLQASAETLNFGKTNGENGLWDRLDTVPTGTRVIRYNGDIRARKVLGMYFSDSADYAEAYHVAGDAMPGDLIAMTEDGLAVNTVPENPAVLGFVSDSFATLIGVDGEHETPVALMGRVRVKVCGPVRAGELLTGSVVPGAVQGVTGCPPRGSIVGQALETDLSVGARRVWAFVVRM